jgi:hypothetical protein
MTNKDMVPRPGPGPAPRGRDAPKGPKRTDGQEKGRTGVDPINDPPDSPQVKPSQDRK